MNHEHMEPAATRTTSTITSRVRNIRVGTNRADWTPAPQFLERWLAHPYMIAGAVMAFSLAFGTYPRAATTNASSFDPQTLLYSARDRINDGRATDAAASTRFTKSSPAKTTNAEPRAHNAAMSDATSDTPIPADFAPDADSALPIRRITLYRSGVGAFERRGTVNDDQTVQLKFRTDQINDMLKSMVLLDLDGGSVQSVRYGSREPLARRLAAFGLNISDQPGLPELVSRLRGSEVRITLANGETLTGTIFGREDRKTVTGEDGTTTQMAYVNVLIGASLRSIEVSAIANFEILDVELQRELEMALNALAEQRADNIKAVDVSFTGDGKRRVIAKYIHEMPVWKTSYRLVLPEVGEQTGDGLMQGWAIVENTTDEDWKDVTLSLVSGRPVGFEMDLYEPLYLDRPEIPVPVLAGISPKIYAGAELGRQANKMAVAPAVSPQHELVDSMRRSRSAEHGMSPFAESGAMEDASANFAGGKAFGSMNDALSASSSAAASGQSDGEVFQYELDTPVTIERQRSAMIPIIAENIDARRVSIYSQGEAHPMKGVEIVNSSGLQIIPGPIAVYDGATYAGDAQIGHVPADDKRLLAFAVDLDVDAKTEYDSTQTVRKLRVTKGVIEQTMKYTSKTSYRIDNKDTKHKRTIIIEQPKMDGWELIDIEPTETTATAYRFEVALDQAASGTLDVAFERTGATHYSLIDMDLNTLQAHVNDGKAPNAIIEAFREAGRLKNTANQARNRLGQLNQSRNEIGNDQSRIRDNMRSIDRNSELYRRYMTKLNDQESTLEQLVTDIATAQSDIQKADRALAEYLSSLNIG